MKSHPSPELLALFVTADLPWLDRWKVHRHVSHCDECDRQLGLFRGSLADLKHQAATETLTGFEAIADWARLEREMQGNIVVGLAAARCIGKARRFRNPLVKLSFAAGLTLLFVLGWATRIPAEHSMQMWGAMRNAFGKGRTNENSGPVLRSKAGGIVVGSAEGSLTIFHPQGAVVSMSGTSAVEARYIDDETGQVTITDVYGQ